MAAMYKVYCLNPIAQVGTDQLGSAYELTDAIEDADAILVRSASMHELDFPESLLAIARAGAGVNNIPLERATESGIVVFNTPGANANSVKESVVAGMLLATRDYVGGIEWVRDNSELPNIAKEAEQAKKRFGGTEIAGKTIGVIGLGAIGAQVANTARQLGMHVMGYDPYLSINAAWSLDRHVKHVTSLDEILSSSDFITIHVPANDKTEGMIGEVEIAKMRDGVIFLNFARDALVDEKAMAAALASGHVARYVTDFANELTASMPGALVLPHLGASTEEAEDRCAIMAAKQLKDYLENGNIVNSVNFGHIDLGPITADARLCLFHKNVPSMIGKITAALSEELNIENMTNKSRGDWAYTLLEVTGSISENTIHTLEAIENVVRVRVLFPSTA